jgi:hypothetical protein
MAKKRDNLFIWDDLVPDLQRELKEHQFDLKKLIRVGVPVRDPDATVKPVPAGGDRRDILLTDGTKSCLWRVESLESLFRGDRQPPELGAYPEAYNECFALLDLHAVEISNIFGDRRDSELKEIFAQLRRRPDGRSTDFVHDYMWQAAALVLGTQILSRAEFEAIMARLERSCRKFEEGPSSRNYVAAMRAVYFKE